MILSQFKHVQISLQNLELYSNKILKQYNKLDCALQGLKITDYLIINQTIPKKIASL